jgi:membrane carboxypeptidase/penicillin-binding protein PbpC
MFDAFSRIRSINFEPKQEWTRWHTETIEVCSFSGLPAGPHCPHRKLSLAVKGLRPRKICPYHDEILVDEKTGLRINKDCESERMHAAVKSVLNLPADVRFWASSTMPTLDLAPRYDPACQTKSVEKGNVFILTPEPKTYWLHSGAKTRDPRTKTDLMTLPLKLKTSGLSSAWHCYLNGRPLSIDTLAVTPTFNVPTGEHSLLCADEQGHTDQVAFEIEK